jgi:hypothetical protein
MKGNKLRVYLILAAGTFLSVLLGLSLRIPILVGIGTILAIPVLILSIDNLVSRRQHR